MAVPKHKKTKFKKSLKSINNKFLKQTLVKCSKCNTLKIPQELCKVCEQNK